MSFPSMLQQVMLALPLLDWQAQMRGRMPASESQRRCLSTLAAWPVGSREVSVHRGSAGKAIEQQHGVSMQNRPLAFLQLSGKSRSST